MSGLGLIPFLAGVAAFEAAVVDGAPLANRLAALSLLARDLAALLTAEIVSPGLLGAIEPDAPTQCDPLPTGISGRLVGVEDAASHNTNTQ